MRSRTNTGLLAGLACAIAATAVFAIPAKSDAYTTLGTKWQGGKITYYNSVKGYDPAVKAAVRAWNKSGAKVQFTRVSRKKARVLIRYLPDSSCRGLARIPRTTRTRSATVYLPRPTAPAWCRDEHTMTIIAAHELGHVLGLNHETRRCALLNPSGNRAGGSLCAEIGGTPPWLWRCRILEPDDVRGAISIYGGRFYASKFKASPLCPIYAEPPAATILGAADSGAGNGIDITIQRPPDSIVPPHLLEQFPGGVPSVYVGYSLGACPAITSATPYSWGAIAVGQSGSRTLGASLPVGDYCVSVWATDAIGRPSAPATQTVTIS